MRSNSDQVAAFGALLQKNQAAAQFYDSCTPAQQQAIMQQLPQLTSRAQLESFVDNLPSATL